MNSCPGEKITQVNVDCYGCLGDLNNEKELVEIMEDAAKKTGATIIGQSVQMYPVHGITAVVFLAESHILVSTYPEIKYAVLEVFMCNDHVDPHKCANLIMEYLKPTEKIKSELVHLIAEKPL